jgi:SAM-dependent methyltransferase
MLRSSLLYLSRQQHIFDFVKNVGFARKMASRFVAGETIATALSAVERLNAKGITASLDLLGESVSSEAEARDTGRQYLELLDRRVQREGLRNVRVVRGDPHDPRLPEASVDVAIMIHMYHEIEQPFALLWNLASSMRPGGRLVILDLERPTFGHGTPAPLLRCELRAMGYQERSFTSTGAEEYVAIFEAPTVSARPTPAAVRAALQRTPCRAS